jgi:hypothetical protein
MQILLALLELLHASRLKPLRPQLIYQAICRNVKAPRNCNKNFKAELIMAQEVKDT